MVDGRDHDRFHIDAIIGAPSSIYPNYSIIPLCPQKYNPAKGPSFKLFTSIHLSIHLHSSIHPSLFIRPDCRSQTIVHSANLPIIAPDCRPFGSDRLSIPGPVMYQTRLFLMI